MIIWISLEELLLIPAENRNSLNVGIDLCLSGIRPGFVLDKDKMKVSGTEWNQEEIGE